jgi:hypothetical protein
MDKPSQVTLARGNQTVDIVDDVRNFPLCSVVQLSSDGFEGLPAQISQVLSSQLFSFHSSQVSQK